MAQFSVNALDLTRIKTLNSASNGTVDMWRELVK
jgi:hypothetical protein